MGQVIGTVNVQVGSQTNPRVNQLTYGIRSLKGSTDLSMSGANTGDAIIYDSNTNSFTVAPVTITATEITNVKGGTF